MLRQKTTSNAPEYISVSDDETDVKFHDCSEIDFDNIERMFIICLFIHS